LCEEEEKKGMLWMQEQEAMLWKKIGALAFEEIQG
jgi:hypothetical protein